MEVTPPPETDINTQLKQAAKDGNLPQVQQMLSLGASVRHSDKRGYTALYWACRYGHAEIAKILIDQGADAQFPNLLGNTPIVVAKMFHHQAVLDVLGDFLEEDVGPPPAKRQRAHD
eukprot:c4269_g1_i1.p2 GENE.c4269_g1_i1~~c4269_g1_i1.p2  ORF type:complete len:117 (+),score=12.31 c4269_g1_i1:191-541(+)